MSLQNKFSLLLEEEFKKRKLANQYYSLRAFAKFLNIDQSILSKFLKRKRDLSWNTIEGCLKKLKVSDSVMKQFQYENKKSDGNYEEIDDSMLSFLSNWRYWAILEYLKIDPSANQQAMSKNLDLKISAIRRAMKVLRDLGFIQKQGNHYVLMKPNNSWITSSKTSEARRELQKKYLKLSLAALENVPMEFRQHGSLTVAIDPAHLPQIKKKINQFQKELGDFCQKKGKLQEVYQMTISFFPLSKVEKND